MPFTKLKYDAEIERRAGQTEVEISKSLFGEAAFQERVNLTRHRLIRKSAIERRGHGGAADPFQYRLLVRRNA